MLFLKKIISINFYTERFPAYTEKSIRICNLVDKTVDFFIVIKGGFCFHCRVPQANLMTSDSCKLMTITFQRELVFLFLL